MTRSPAPSAPLRAATVTALLFGSGFCALIYQTAWLRQFRLIFGASTFATAAVLAIFLGGLGIGSALLGKRADAHPRPLRFYGNLELLIAASAALSQVLLWIVAKIYFATGGSVTLGLPLASVVRLLLSALVLAVPTVLMGGTLPAAARAIESADDEGRRRLALLYGTNTLGAVAGTLLSTFFMLETFGNRKTLLIAVMINLLVGVAARALVTPSVVEGPGGSGDAPPSLPGPSTTLGMTLGAAAVVGFAFLLMELVWYRMLAPLLGGSTFTFGLILAIALLGIGLGGAAYAFWSGRTRATAGAFALTCSLEAAAIAFPLMLGDRLAVQQNLLRGLGVLGFHGYVFAWTILTLIVVFPAAFIAGVQFPLLISLLGRGRESVGRHVGLAYAWNTAGAIAGSLAGGFGLPLLSAPGAWRLVIVLLAFLGIVAMAFALRQRQMAASVLAAVVALLAIAGTFALGPTAVWRHSGIGAGRGEAPNSPNEEREWEYRARRTLVWEVDGRESSVALIDPDDDAFVINGKTDGSARGDAGTQVMAGLVGAAIHPAPRRALVIGLGTGSTAGWLGAVPGMERVDVVELEPAVIGVAAACGAVNHDVLHNRRVHIRIGDAREVLLASRDRYDIVFSEPSNPYRAGIASLFTEEFYRAASARLNRGGIFLQWVQAYDVDAQTIRTIYATIGTVFRSVDTWHTDTGDLLLAASLEPMVIDVERLRARVRTPPYLSAMSNTWRVESVEGFLGHFVANDVVTRAIARGESELNTDDRTLVEFGFARGLGEVTRFQMDDLTAIARARGADRPLHILGTIDWNLVYANRASFYYLNQLPLSPTPEMLARHRAAAQYAAGSLPAALNEWRANRFPPVNTAELSMIAESLAEAGSDAAEAYAQQLRPWNPVDADAILARLRYRQARIPESVAFLERAFITARTTPWPSQELMQRSFGLTTPLAKTQAYAPGLFNALAQPFAAGQLNDTRRIHRVEIARDLEGCGPHTVAALRAMEPWPPWTKEMLTLRRDCYRSAMMTTLASRAERELAEFLAEEPAPLVR